MTGRNVGHQWPQVGYPAAESKIRTFLHPYPFQPDMTPPRRLRQDFDAESPGRSVGHHNRIRRRVVVTDAQLRLRAGVAFAHSQPDRKANRNADCQDTRASRYAHTLLSTRRTENFSDAAVF